MSSQLPESKLQASPSQQLCALSALTGLTPGPATSAAPAAHATKTATMIERSRVISVSDL